MRNFRLIFYLPIIVLWGAVFLTTLNPALILSDIRFDPDIQRNDLMRISPGGDVELDDIVIYRLNWIDYVARVIALPGDRITMGLDGRSIIRNGERVVVSPRGFEIATNETGLLEIEEGRAAVYVHNDRRNSFSAVVGQESIRGPVVKVYRYAAFGRSEWLTIGFYSGIVLTLIFLPYLAFTRQRSPNLFRIVVMVTHTFLILAVASALLMASLPGDPMRVGAEDPIWWWFPLAVVAGLDLELLLVVALFLAVQWLWFSKPWRRGGKADDPKGPGRESGASG